MNNSKYKSQAIDICVKYNIYILYIVMATIVADNPHV